jgi:hypothetical protein
MRVREVTCTNCRASIPPDLLDSEFHRCPRCEEWLQVYLFPAFRRADAVVAAEPIMIEGESSCFYHPQKRAVVACENCGRFVCALCDVELSGLHRCPRCLESDAKPTGFELQHTRYDHAALALTTIALLFSPITIITAPVALFLVIRFWNRRSSVLARSRAIFVIAGVLAVVEICGWVVLIYLGAHGWRL